MDIASRCRRSTSTPKAVQGEGHFADLVDGAAHRRRGWNPFVWCAANLYVGDVEVVTDQPTPDLVVNVYNQKGQATNYHVNKFQLMPGSYHIEILPDGKTKIPANIEVNFHSVNRLVVHAPSSGKFKLAAFVDIGRTDTYDLHRKNDN